LVRSLRPTTGGVNDRSAGLPKLIPPMVTLLAPALEPATPG
jgi:hypothetical protein